MRKYLITGGCGFIGSSVIRRVLSEPDTQVMNLDKLTYAGNSESLQDVSNSSRYCFEQIDICDTESLHDVVHSFRPDVIIHLAAESHVDRSINDADVFIQTNIVGTYNLLQITLEYWKSLPCGSTLDESLELESGRTQNFIIEKSNVVETSRSSFRFLHISTDEVYGSLQRDSSEFTESSPYAPHSPYSASKAASDHLVRAWQHTYNLPVIVANSSNNYGPYQFPEKLIPLVILKCLRGEAIPVYAKGENIRDWLYVEDHAEALYLLVNRGRVGETYNIGGDNQHSNIDLVRQICRMIDELVPQNIDGGHETLITFVEDRPGHDFRYAMDISKISNELGWRPREDFESGLRKTVKWYVNHQDLWSRR